MPCQRRGDCWKGEVGLRYSQGASAAFRIGSVVEGKEEKQGGYRWRSVQKERSRSERSKEGVVVKEVERELGGRVKDEKEAKLRWMLKMVELERLRAAEFGRQRRCLELIRSSDWGSLVWLSLTPKRGDGQIIIAFDVA